MEHALAIVKETGSIVRYKYGFWAKENSEMTHETHNGDDYYVPLDWVGVESVEALERRGLVVPGETKTSHRGPFTVKYILKS